MSARARMAATAGVSLLELLVATALLAAVAAMVTASLATGARVWARAEPTAAPALARLAAIVATASMRRVQNPDFSVGPLFRGRANETVFHRWARGTDPGLDGWRLAVEPSAGGIRLAGYRARLRRPRDLLGLADWGRPVFALDGLRGAEFAYAGPVAPGAEGPSWQADWPAAGDGPRLLRLTLDDGRRPQALVVHLGVGR